MRYHNITKDDMLNGDGLRVVLWVSGCSHKCKGCHNPITWDPKCGLEFDASARNEIFAELDKDYVSGITFSGGDPLHPANIHDITELAAMIRQIYPHKTIWLYTGYQWEEVQYLDIVQYIDILVDGKFVEELKDNNLHWKGSSNQNVIDVKKSLRTGEIIIYG